jgi:hypothetical protein
MITDINHLRMTWRDRFESTYGAGRWEEFCKLVVVDKARPGATQAQFHNVNTHKQMTAAGYGLWSERAHRNLDGLV